LKADQQESQDRPQRHRTAGGKPRRPARVTGAFPPPHEVTSRYEPDLDGDTPIDPLPQRWAQRYQEGPTPIAPSGPASPRP